MDYITYIRMTMGTGKDGKAGKFGKFGKFEKIGLEKLKNQYFFILEGWKARTFEILTLYVPSLVTSVAPCTGKINKMALVFLKEEKFPTKWYTTLHYTVFKLSQSAEMCYKVRIFTNGRLFSKRLGTLRVKT